MTVRDRLHRLVDLLPDEDAETAERILEALHAAPRLPDVLRNAPRDDEPDNDDFDGGLTEARRELARGEVVTDDVLRRELGI